MKTTDAKLLATYRQTEATMGRLAAQRLEVGAIMAQPEWKTAKALGTALYAEIKRRGLLAELSAY